MDNYITILDSKTGEVTKSKLYSFEEGMKIIEDMIKQDELDGNN